ncbi:MAG TPA: NAD(P)-dependent oxidoreductase [Thermoleophilaceae bacterium]|nr:NAD(P)-dependent oxidoreductase [Thermoleophilaceae bacterium]
MKVFVAGATGAIGSPLVRVLVDAGHEVVATTRSQEKVESLRAAGAEPVVADGLDRESLLAAVNEARPEVVVHELTALPSRFDTRRFDRTFQMTNRLRREGTDNLLEAARAAGTRRFVVQSFAGWPYEPSGGPVKTEEDALDPEPPKAMRATLDAIRHLESAVLGADGLVGIVLRYGGFYGPGTGVAVMLDDIRRRRFPIVGKGTGMWSFVHTDDAGRATLAAIERGAPGIYNIVDDEPAPVSEWLPYLAETIGARAPRRVPTFIGRLAAGEAGLYLMTRARGASNAKAKRELGWEPRFRSWRQGFREGLG